MLEKKRVWDVIDNLRLEPTIAEPIRKKDKDTIVITKIIIQEVNSDLYIYIKNEQDPHRSWEIFQ